MSSDALEQSLIRNEQIIRHKNTNAKDAIKKYFNKYKKVKEDKVPFACECSDLNCKEQVNISINEYETIHKRKDRFVIANGHETPLIENVVSTKPRAKVVEKEKLSP